MIWVALRPLARAVARERPPAQPLALAQTFFTPPAQPEAHLHQPDRLANNSRRHELLHSGCLLPFFMFMTMFAFSLRQALCVLDLINGPKTARR